MNLWAQPEEPFRGWEDYPKNLDNFCPLLEDSARYHERLQQLSHVLFSEKSVVSVIDAEGAFQRCSSSSTTY
jgi:hypothetical protein